MRSGRLRHRVTIQEKTTARDTSGQVTHTWAAIAGGDNIHAAVEPMAGREFETSDQVSTETKTRILLRYRAGITTQMRVKFGALLYNIQTVINHKSRNKEITLLCSEGLSDGG